MQTSTPYQPRQRSQVQQEYGPVERGRAAPGMPPVVERGDAAPTQMQEVPPMQQQQQTLGITGQQLAAVFEQIGQHGLASMVHPGSMTTAQQQQLNALSHIQQPIHTVIK